MFLFCSNAPICFNSERSDETNLLKLAIDAARARATVGEITDALEVTFGRHVANTSVVSGVYGASYGGGSEQLDADVSDPVNHIGLCVFCVCILCCVYVCDVCVCMCCLYIYICVRLI